MITYKHANKELKYGPRGQIPEEGRGHEYELFLHVLGILAASEQNNYKDLHCFGLTDTNSFIANFGGKESQFLIREQRDGDGFPDFVIVRETKLLIFDHFHVDASGLRNKKGKDNGSPYIAYLKSHKTYPLDEILEYAQNEGIKFCTNNLRDSIARTFKKHAAKIDKYNQAVLTYIESNADKDIAYEDTNKPIENWFFIEDITPTSDFQTIKDTLDKLFEDFTKVSGAVYLHRPIPEDLPQNGDDIAIFWNRQSTTSKPLQPRLAHFPSRS